MSESSLESTELDRPLVSDVPVEAPAPEPSSGYESRRRRRLFCFECNRPEGHYLASWGRSMFSFLIGFTFGLIFIIGPYRCNCCGVKRLMRYDVLNPRSYFRRSLVHSKDKAR